MWNGHILNFIGGPLLHSFGGPLLHSFTWNQVRHDVELFQHRTHRVIDDLLVDARQALLGNGLGRVHTLSRDLRRILRPGHVYDTLQ